MSGAPAEDPGSASGPRFSVIIPTHQSRDYVLAAIRCALGQTVSDLEVVVLDNGSTDGTTEAVSAIDDPRLIYRWQEDSGLPADSRNKALALASGQWACFLDADDTWVPSKLERVAAVIDADPDVTMVAHDVRMVDTTGSVIKRRGYALDDRPLYDQLLYRGNFLTTSATCVRRDAIGMAGGFDTRADYFTVEDYDLWLRIAETGARLAMINEPLGDFLVHAASASSKLVRNYDALMRVYDDHALRRAAEGALDVEAMVHRRRRARLAEVRDLARGGDITDAVRIAAALPGELRDARRRYLAASGDAGDAS